MKWMNKLRSIPAMIICIFILSFGGSQIMLALLTPIFSLWVVIIMVFLWAMIVGHPMGKYYPTKPKSNSEPQTVLGMMDNLLDSINGTSGD